MARSPLRCIPKTRMQLIAAADVGAFAAAAFGDPGSFASQDIDLAAEALTMSEVAGTLESALGRAVTAVALTPEQALARGLAPGWIRSQEWSNEVGLPGRYRRAGALGRPTHLLRELGSQPLQRHRRLRSRLRGNLP